MTRIEYLKKLKRTLYLKKLSINEAMILIALATLNRPCIAKEVETESGVCGAWRYLKGMSQYLIIETNQSSKYRGGVRYVFQLNREGKELTRELL